MASGMQKLKVLLFKAFYFNSDAVLLYCKNQ